MTEPGSNPSSRPYLVDCTFPEHEVHLISGPSGAGKTTLALQIAADYSDGLDIFGQPSYPAPLCYIACERSKSSLHRAMSRLGIPLDKFPHESMVHALRGSDRSVESVLRIANHACPRMKLLFLDGLASLCPGKLTDYRDLSNFLISLSRLCKEQLITIIGIVYSSKVRDGEGYISPRDRIAGSAAWSTITDTKILIEPVKPSKPIDALRTITILPTNQPSQVLTYAMVEGRLQPMDSSGTALLQPEMDAWLESVPEGTEVSTQDLLAEGLRNALSRATIYRWIENQKDLGMLIRVGHGKYQKSFGGSVQ